MLTVMNWSRPSVKRQRGSNAFTANAVAAGRSASEAPAGTWIGRSLAYDPDFRWNSSTRSAVGSSSVRPVGRYSARR